MSEKTGGSVWLWLLVVLVVLGIPALLIWWVSGGYMLGMMGMMGYSWGFTPLIGILFLVLIVLGAYYLITALAWQPRSESKDSGRALEILKERYARGEISREQYLKVKEELES